MISTGAWVLLLLLTGAIYFLESKAWVCFETTLLSNKTEGVISHISRHGQNWAVLYFFFVKVYCTNYENRELNIPFGQNEIYALRTPHSALRTPHSALRTLHDFGRAELNFDFSIILVLEFSSDSVYIPRVNYATRVTFQGYKQYHSDILLSSRYPRQRNCSFNARL